MVSPEIIGLGAGAVAIGAAAIYAFVSGESTSASIDVDDDGTDEATVEFGGNDKKVAEHDTNEDVKEQANPTPDAVLEKSGLTAIKGIQDTRAERLGKAGYSDPADIYYASDENLEDVKGIGPYTVEQIRDDIGSVEDDPNGESDEGQEEASQDSTEQDNTNQQSDSNESNESPSAEAETQSQESDGSDSGEKTESGGNESEGNTGDESDDS